MNEIIKSAGGLVVVITVLSLLFFIWTDGFDPLFIKILLTEAILIMVIYVADKMTEKKSE